MTERSRKLKRSSRVRRKKDPIPWKYCFLTLICGLLLVGGFFWAARQHFASMDYGMKNAKLRKQIEELKSEKRRLTLSREISHSPAEIKKAASKLGLTTMTAENIEVVKQPSRREAKPLKTFRKPDSNKGIKKSTPQKSESKNKKSKAKVSAVKQVIAVIAGN